MGAGDLSADGLRRGWGGVSLRLPSDRGLTAVRSGARALVDATYRRLPLSLRQQARVGDLLDEARIAADLRTFVTLHRLRGRAAVARDGAWVDLRTRALGGANVSVRPGTSDTQVVHDTFIGRHHLPPRGARMLASPRILDLGANIGLTMAHFAVVYPDATILGVELEPANAVLASANVARWHPRCTVIEGAVWHSDGVVSYQGETGDEFGFRIVPDGGGAPTVRAFSMNGLIERIAGDRSYVDFVKMDIEGAETEVLRHNTEWAARVGSIKVEGHNLDRPEASTLQQCHQDLARLGFDSRIDDAHWGSVSGTRRTS